MRKGYIENSINKEITATNKIRWGRMIMGTGYCPQESEISFLNIDYSKTHVILAILRYMEECKASAKKMLNAELMGVFLDMEEAINNVSITDKQRMALNLYREGYTEHVIGATMDGISHQAVHHLLVKVANKYSKYLLKGVAK